ncbi:MAG: TonB-dependent receptor, partial [Candidatus Margulisiibacteriota bacterium]
MSFELGSYGNQNISLRLSQGTQESNYQLGLIHGRYEGYQPVGYFNNDNLLLEYNGVLGRDLRVRLSGSGYTDQRGNPAGPYSTSEQEDRGYMVLAQIRQMNENSETDKLYFTTKSDERKSISGFVTDSKGWTNALGGSKEINVGDHALIIGLETNQMIPQDSTLTQNISLRNNAVFINDDWVVSPWWRVNAGLRQDAHSTFGTADTYKVSTAFSIGNSCILKTSYGTSFRAPSIADLYYQDAWGNAGNPNLRPETARNFDLEFSVKTPIGDFRSSCFEKKITDLIEWVSAADWSSSSPNNVGRARLSGIETEWSGTLTETVLYNVNWT